MREGGKTEKQRARRPTVRDKPERDDDEQEFGDPPTHLDQPPLQDDDDEPVAAIPMLHVAVHEAAPYLAAAERAIVMANHAVVVATTGREGIVSVSLALAAGGIDAVIVGMPGGELVIDAAHMVQSPRPIIIAAYSGLGSDAAVSANAEGADLVTIRPHDPDKLAVALLSASRLLDAGRVSRGPRRNDAALRARSEDNTREEPRGLQRFDVFQRVLELELKSARRHHHPLAVGLFALDVPSPPPSDGLLKLVRAKAALALIDTMRDVDLATELDADRFLMLFPYTDLTEAAEISRQIIAAVRASEPVTSEGRTITPALVGAVAGTGRGKPPSFARLMRDATRALDQAFRDGAELAISVAKDSPE